MSGLSAQQHYELAQKLHRQQRYAEAEQHYRQVIAMFGDYAGALTRLGEVCFLQQRHEDAAAFYRRAVKAAPKDPAAKSGLGCSLNALGRHEEALQHIDAAIALAPERAEFQLDRGNALTGLGRLEHALAAYSKAAAMRPDFVAAHHAAGLSLVRLARREEAAARFETVLALRPDHLPSLMNLGAVSVSLGRIEQAVGCYERAIRMKPDLLQAHVELAVALQDINEHEGAVEWLRKAIALAPGEVQVHNLLGRSLGALGRSDEAAAEFEQSLALNPHSADTHFEIGKSLQLAGAFGEARAAFDRALSLKPDTPLYWYFLVQTQKTSDGDRAIPALQEMASRSGSFPQSDQAAIHFALGKVYDDLHRYEEAFACFVKANAIERQLLEYDEAGTLAMLESIAGLFSSTFLAAVQGAGDASDLPVFIVGMPRSGTTLVEQILASHPKVFGAGEMGDLARIYDSLKAGNRPLSRQEVDAVGRRYVDIIRRKSPDAVRVANKMPGNFASVGLIAAALPRASIIHVTRDPLDTCFSCFAHLFNYAHQYSYDLGELGRYHRAYQRLMAHWRNILPAGAMLEIGYEELIDDFDAQARRIVAHCGLEWDQRCLAFHQTRRPVDTASAFQVRQPLYRSAVGHAARYAAWLGPLRAALEAR